MFDLLLVSAPTLAFLLVNAGTGALTPSLSAAGAAATAVFVWRSVRREPLRTAIVGLLVVTVCAVVAGVTGQARGFFLVPALVPFAVILVCLASLATRRPLTGVLLNRLSGGPLDWHRVAPIRRVHVKATLVCVAVNIVNATVQVVYYQADEPAVLGITHMATGPVFATIVAATLAYARRAVARSPVRYDAAGLPSGC